MLRTVLATFLAALCVRAQAPAPVLVHLTVSGPGEWRSRLGPSNLGTMLACQQAEAIWRCYVDTVDAALRRARGADEAFVAERARFLDYGGDIHLVAWLEQAEHALHLPRWSAALVAEPDGHTDLTALAAECNGWLARAGAAAATRWLELELLPPRLHDGRMIAVLASREDLEAASERAERFVCAAMDRTKVLRVDVEMQAVLGLLRDRAAERDLVAALVGPASRRATVEIGSVGPRVAIDFSLAFGDGDRGVAQGLLPVRPRVVDLDHLIPDGTATHYAWPVDFPGLWQGLVAALAAAAERDVKKYRDRLNQSYGCDLGKDVWSQFEPEVMLLWRHGGEADADDASLFAHACLVALVRDEAALIDAAGPVLKQLGLSSQRSEDGVLWSDAADFSLRIGFGVACVAFGSHSKAQCEAVLDRAAASRRRSPALPTPPGAPAGWNGQGRMDVTTLLARDLYGQLRWLLFAFGGLQHLPRVLEVQKEGERWLPLLRQHQLDHAKTLGGSTLGAWQLRILW